MAGEPVHDVPVQQSAVVWHAVPAAPHAPEHRFKLPAACVQAPLQQSPATPHGAPTDLHAPGPRSQLLFTQSAQQPGPPPELQSSPVARHPALVSSAHFLSTPHVPEQHVCPVTQSSPSRVQRLWPQTPPLQPTEQQSWATAHDSPSRLQKSLHCRMPRPGAGSHEPLQHSARVVHVAPGSAHVPFGMHVPDSQRPEQHSPSSEHVSLTPWQGRGPAS